MANSETIKTAIDANINTNGNQAITGAVMNSVLKQMVNFYDLQQAKLSDETRKLGNIINGSPQETLGWQQDGYYGINDTVSEGDVVDVNVRQNSVYRCLMAECSEGDSFLYTGCNSGFRPFAFLDAEYRLLPNYGVFGTKYKDEKITAPQGAAYVIMQTIYNEWVELGSLPCQRVGNKGMGEKLADVENNKVDNTQIVQRVGDSEKSIMSQKAVSGILSEQDNVIKGVESKIIGSPQETLDWQQNGYYSITESEVVGDVVDVNVRPYSTYRCLMMECSEGDSFLYTGRNSGFRPFAFLDSEYRLLPNYGVFGMKYKNEQIIAPQGSAYVIMQTIYNEWVELGSLPCQRQEREGIEDAVKKMKDAVLVSPNTRTASESMQALSNLNIQSELINNICNIGDFSDASLWRTSTPNMTLSVVNGVAKMTSSNASGNASSEISVSNFGWFVVPQGKKAFIAIKARTNIDNLHTVVKFNSVDGFKGLNSDIPLKKNSIWDVSCIEYIAEKDTKATAFFLGATTLGTNIPSGGWYEVKDLIVGIYDADSNMTKERFVKLVRNAEWFFGNRIIPNADRFLDLDTILYNDIVVSVGEQGDFQTISAAMAYLSQFYQMYKYGGIKAEIRILSGTTITDQVLVVGADYSWMTITYEGYDPDGLTYDNVAESIANGTIVFGQTSGYNAVAVDASSWSSSGVTHDTRGDVCLFRAEDGGRLPKIKCVFKLTNKGKYDVAGICCNRGSSCVVATLCGFIGFNDGVIANNESSITIREGITMNCGRWGCHARHNGEVSARSVIAVGCATDAKYSGESAALCADRIADLDGREAWVSCGNALAVRNASRMNCNGTHILGTADETAIIYAAAVSVGNFTSLYIDAGVKIDHSQGAVLSVSEYTFRESYVFNDVTNKGIIYK